MHPFRSKIGVSNARTAPRVVAVEPWGNDYTLLPGEELEVIAFGREATPWFHVVESDEATRICCEDADTFEVLQSGRELECGYRRQSKPRPVKPSADG